MKFSQPILALSTAAALPALASAWSMGGPASNRIFFPPSSVFLDSPAARMMFDEVSACRPGGPGGMMESRRRGRGRRGGPSPFYRPSSQYEITEDENTFKLTIDVPGVKMEDINISLEDNILTVTASRETANENSRFASRFSQGFTMDPIVDLDKISASLENGVLVVSAPKDLKRIETNVRSIPISVGATAAEAANVAVSNSAVATDDSSTSEAPVSDDVVAEASSADAPSVEATSAGVKEASATETNDESSDEVMDLDETPKVDDADADKKDGTDNKSA